MSRSSQPLQGDPAFNGSDAITHAPLDEERRFESSPGAGALKHPFPWALIGTAVAIVLVGIVAGMAAGWAYLIPIGAVGVLIAAFALGNYHLGHNPERVPDELPNFGVDEREGAGGNPEQSDERRTSHDDMNRSATQ